MKENEIKIYLTNLVKMIDVEITVVDKEIIVENERIEFIKQQLKRITNNIVLIEEEIKKLDLYVSEMKAQREREESIIRDIERDVENSKRELYYIYAQMEKQRQIIRDAYPFGFLVKGVLDLYNQLSGEYERIQRRTEELRGRLEKLHYVFRQSEERIREIADNMNRNYMEQKKLTIFREKSEMELSNYGKNKTNSENLKLDLNKFRLKCTQVLDKIKMNLEFDEMFYSEEEIKNTVNEIFKTYGRTVPHSIMSSTELMKTTNVEIPILYSKL